MQPSLIHPLDIVQQLAACSNKVSKYLIPQHLLQLFYLFGRKSGLLSGLLSGLFGILLYFGSYNYKRSKDALNGVNTGLGIANYYYA